jgi:hypothetical protein
MSSISQGNSISLNREAQLMKQNTAQAFKQNLIATPTLNSQCIS